MLTQQEPPPPLRQPNLEAAVAVGKTSRHRTMLDLVQFPPSGFGPVPEARPETSLYPQQPSTCMRPALPSLETALFQKALLLQCLPACCGQVPRPSPVHCDYVTQWSPGFSLPLVPCKETASRRKGHKGPGASLRGGLLFRGATPGDACHGR